MHLAAEKGHTEVCRCLLSSRGSVNAKAVTAEGNKGHCRTPLHLASLNGHSDTVLWLLMAGAEVSPQDYQKNMPIHLACIGGHVDCFEALVNAGAVVDTRAMSALNPRFGNAASPTHLRDGFNLDEVVNRTRVKQGKLEELIDTGTVTVGYEQLHLSHNTPLHSPHSQQARFLQDAILIVEDSRAPQIAYTLPPKTKEMLAREAAAKARVDMHRSTLEASRVQGVLEMGGGSKASAEEFRVLFPEDQNADSNPTNLA